MVGAFEATEISVVGAVELAGKHCFIRVVPFEVIRAMDLHGHEVHPKLRILGDVTTGGAGWPTVFIIKPVFQTSFFAVVSHGIGEFKPFITKIFRLQTHTGMHEVASESHGVKYGHLTEEFVLVKLAVPSPERLRPPLSGRIGELFKQLLVAQMVGFTVMASGEKSQQCCCGYEYVIVSHEL